MDIRGPISNIQPMRLPVTDTRLRPVHELMHVRDRPIFIINSYGLMLVVGDNGNIYDRPATTDPEHVVKAMAILFDSSWRVANQEERERYTWPTK